MKKLTFGENIVIEAPSSPENETDSFNTAKMVLTPALKKAPAFKVPTNRSATSVAPPSTLSRPNYEGLLYYVSNFNIYFLVSFSISNCML